MAEKSNFIPEDILDSVFGGLDTALSSVDEALKSARINADLSRVRDSVKKAGHTASNTVRKARMTPVPAGKTAWGVLLERLLSRLPLSIRRLFSRPAAPAPQPQVADEDIPFVQDEPPAPAAPAPEPPPMVRNTGDPALDGILSAQLLAIGTIEDAATEIYQNKPATALQLERILALYRRILVAVSERPQRQNELHRFTSYYIPTLHKFTATYAALCDDGTAAAQKTMAEIEAAFGRIETGFRKKLDDIFAADALDIAADISVMDSMLNQ